MNTLDQAAMMVQQAGVDISVDISETEDEVIYVIKMKKQLHLFLTCLKRSAMIIKKGAYKQAERKL